MKIEITNLKKAREILERDYGYTPENIPVCLLFK